MATLKQIREGLAANLAVLDGWQVSAYMLSQPTPPAIHVVPGLVEFDRAMGRGLDEWTLNVQAFVPLNSDRGAQERLDGLIDGSGATSVKEAVEADRTLGGAADTARVVACTGYRTVAVEGRGPVLMCEWEVHVLAAGEQ